MAVLKVWDGAAWQEVEANLSGTAGGDLTGTYPNPSVIAATTTTAGKVELATDGENAANVVVQGNDSRLSDSRTPTGSEATTPRW